MPSHTVKVGNIDLHYVEEGSGPLLLLVHGFPETSHSWRHQVGVLAQAGYRVIAPDMRGYGQSSKPTEAEAYSISHLVGDLVGLVAALGETEAILIAHDWGGVVAWYAALMRPDLFRALAVMGAPYSPPMHLPAGVRLTDVIRARSGGGQNYRVAFAHSSEVESELNADVAGSLRAMLYTFSGDVVKDGERAEGWAGVYPAGESFRAQLTTPTRLPSWLTEADLQLYAEGLGAEGFSPGLSYYRNLDALPTLLAPFLGKKITQPALYLYGEHDHISGNTPEAMAVLRDQVPLVDIQCVAGGGHWLQQEQPAVVNEALLGFLKRVN